jgi:hypothetical protein
MKFTITYDMQKLDEAVSILATGTESLQDRLRDSIIPLLILRANGDGMHNKKRAGTLDEICAKLSDMNDNPLNDDDARALAQAIVDLQNLNWHDAVWALEEKA